MKPNSRREFLSEVGQGMLVASLGTSLASHLGVSTAFAAEDDPRLSFGKLEPLVGLMQETPTAKILPALVGKLNAGVPLRQLVAAGALANARTFGGENYHGFHTFMALAPAFDMSKEMPKGQEALPILKVLYRNSFYTGKNGGHAKDVLKPVKAAKETAIDKAAQQLRAATNATDKAKAEQLLAALAEQSLESALNGVLHHVEDNHNVHTIVMPWRAWDVLELTGKEHAITLLRQSVRQCAGHNSRGTNRAVEQRRAFIPKLLDEYKLLSRPVGKRKADDAWVEKFALNILTLDSNQAAEAAAVALAEGILPEHVGEAISLAANQLILRQVEVWEGYGRRTHGDSRGVHASDMINAWRNIARVCSHRHAVTGLIIAAQNVSNSHNRPKGHRQTPFAAGQRHKPFGERLVAFAFAVAVKIARQRCFVAVQEMPDRNQQRKDLEHDPDRDNQQDHGDNGLQRAKAVFGAHHGDLQPARAFQQERCAPGDGGNHRNEHNDLNQ